MEFNATMNAAMNLDASGQTATAFTLTVPAIIAVIAFVCLRFWPPSLDPKEPRLISSYVPFIGHAIGMLRHQQRYFEMLSNKYTLPIYTLKILSGRLYIVTAPDLIAAIFRNAKAFSFEPFLIQSTEHVMNVKGETLDIVKKPAEVEGGELYLNDVHRAMYDGLASPQALLDMEMHSFRTIAMYFNGIGTDGLKTRWYRWLRDTISRAAADAMYGPDNPVAHDPSLIDTVWDFDGGIPALMMGVAPSWLASKAYKARGILEKAWLPYYAAGLNKNASAIVRGRREAALKWGIAESEVQRWEYVMFFAPTTNSGPTAYWLLSYILADPELLKEIREEVSKVTTISTVGGIKKVSFDITRIQKECPLLVAAWEESFRLSAATVSVRMVMEDTMLAEKYLLKKGAVIQMPSAPSSQSEAIWGPNPDKFNARRMLKSNYDALSREDRKMRTQAYFPWGGGKYICPGKQFASTELIGVVGSLLYGFDIKTSNGEQLKTPVPGIRQIGRNVDLPISDIEVVIRRREEFEGIQFAYYLGNDLEV